MRRKEAQSPVPILIDCDPGIDDAVAILLSLASPEFDLRAITTVSGNLTADICARNANRVLDLAQADNIKVARGPLKPLVRPYPRDPFSHGADGLADLNLPQSSRTIAGDFAPDVILETAEAANGDLHLVCLGPLTNLALACIKDPGLPSKVASVTLIGGAFGFHQAGSTRATGDNPASEWNIYVDPEAADIVFRAGFDLRAVGLDVATHPEVELGPDHRARLQRAGTAAAQFLLDVTAFVERRGFRSYCGLIDAIAVSCLVDPDILDFQEIGVLIETESKIALGQTVVDRRENFRWPDLPTIKAAARIDATSYLDLLVTRLTAGPA